jgi:photosystem II stability/assembly factor-like uncharacterized protein
VACVLDDSHWYVEAAGSKAHFYATSDAGKTWNDLAPSGIADNWGVKWLGFIDQTHGFAVVGLGQSNPGASLFLSTKDGGRSWAQVVFGNGVPPYVSGPTKGP